MSKKMNPSDNSFNRDDHLAKDPTAIKLTRRPDDWEQEQETLYLLRNSSLLQQISESIDTHKATPPSSLRQK